MPLAYQHRYFHIVQLFPLAPKFSGSFSMESWNLSASCLKDKKRRSGISTQGVLLYLPYF